MGDCYNEAPYEAMTTVLQELYLGIEQRIGQNRDIKIIFGACTKPCSDSRVPSEIERICSNTDLKSFLDLAKGTYHSVTFQVILETNRVPPFGQSPPPDPCPYFPQDRLPISDVPHDPVTSDSYNELYLLQFGKKKQKIWLRADHGFELEKAKVRKQIRCLQSYLDEVKDRHKKLLGAEYNDVIDADSDKERKQLV